VGGEPCDASARRDVLRAAIVAGAVLGVLCWSYFTWGVVPLSRMDEPAPSARHPSHLGHVDVLVVDSRDRVVRGHVVADYEGRFAKDPRWEARLRAVEEEVPKAIRDVREQLGIDDLPVPPIVVRFRDDEQMGHKQFMATFQEIRGKEVLPLVVVGVDSLLSMECDIREGLRHEIAHCFHLAALGDRFYDLPSWAKEGLADWATGRRGWRMDWLYATECDQFGADPAKWLVDGLDGENARGDYAEYYLAFAYVEDAFGVAAARKLVRELFTRTDVDVALHNATNLYFNEFVRRARAWALDYVHRDMADYPAYLKAKGAFRGGEYAAADQAYGAYLGGKEPLHFRLNALLEQAECRIQTRDATGARLLLDQAETTHPVGPLNDRILHDQACVAGLDADWVRVQALCLEFIDSFKDNDQVRTHSVRKLLWQARDRLAGRVPVSAPPIRER